MSEEQNIPAEIQVTESADGAAVALAPAREGKQYCIFRAGRERFCLEVLDVEEVVEWPSVTPVPL